MKKWNYQTHQYDDYSVPEDWKVSMYETDMDKQINCVECGKPMKYGESLTSQRIYDDAVGEERIKKYYLGVKG